MPVKRNSWPANSNDSHNNTRHQNYHGGDCDSKSHAGSMNVPPENSLMQQLLMDLGYPDVAKMLEEKVRHRLQLLSGSFSEPTNISGNGANGLDTANVNKNDATMGGAKGAETAVEHKCKGDKVYPPSGAIKAEGGECEARKLPPHFNTTTITLFASLMHRGSGDGVDGVKNTSALNELCRLAIDPLRGNLYSTSPTADNNHGSNNNNDDDNGANSLISHLQKLFNVFMDSSSKNNNDTNYYYEKEHGEGRGRKQLHINLSPGWVSILEVFFAYIGVLWEQLCLVEAVSWADFTSQGWLDHRHKILKSLSYLQEKLQRLLLDAHLLEMNSCTCEDSPPSQGGNQPSVAVELSSVEKNKNNSFSSYFSEHEPQLFMKDIQAGVVALFCRGAPTLRKNMEDVFTWIMSHCGRLTSKQNECNNNDNNNKSNNNSGVRKKEPFTYSVNDNDSSSSYSSPSSSSCGDGGGNKKSEEQEEEEEESVGHKPWQMFMGIVRNAALGEGGKASEMLSSHKYESAPAFNPALQWSQTFFRIQFLSWVIGSIAELSEVLLHHNQTCVEKTNCKSDKRQKKGSEATTRKASIVCVSLGFWYQNCASQITEFLDMNKEKSACKPKSCFFQTKLSEEGRSIGLSLVNTLKSIEHEFLAGTSIMPEPLHLSIIRDDINSATGTNFFKSKGNQGILHPHAVYNKENDIHTAILSILATGQPLVIDSVSEPQDKRNTLHRVLKKVLRTPKKLLDMQDERVAVDDQLRCMENMTLYTLLSHWKGNGTVQKGLPNRSRGNQSQNEKSFNDHVMVRIYEGDISLSGEVLSGIGNPGQNAAENTSTGIGVDLGFSLDALDMPSSFSSPRLSLHYQLQGFMRRLTSGENETQQSEESPSVFFEDDEGTNSTEQNLNDPMDEVLNEVQIVSVTPCGSLLALLTTKGRLIVFALHAAKNINHKMANKRIQESFCEQMILDTSLMKSTKCPYWYEQLESFLAFSPCGRFLLCSVQNAPPYVEEGDEKNRSHIETTGKVFIYSLHCTEVEYSDASETLQQQQQQQQQHHNVGGDEERLYAAFQIHKTLITVARWLDPRFWRDKLFSFSSMHPLEKSAPVWKREAQQRLSSLQCLSSGRDNLILRWSPADGTIIQRIATFPVFDILVSPLMQAFYTINQNGELSMYDAWNERDVESATENVVIVSQRGLPAALSMLQLSGELPDGSTQKTANPMKDGEMQEAFFMGTRVIGFDRRSLVNYGVDGGGGGASYGSAMARMSRVMQESGLPSGTETKEGNRLGRRIVQHVVHQGGDYLTPHTPAVIEPSSDSESDNSDDTQSNISGGRRGYHHGRSANRDHMNPGENPISFLRASRSQSERNKIYPSHSDPRKRSYNNPSIVGGTALYKTGARLVFEEVSQELCISASLWPRNPDIKFTYLPSLDSPQLLSMAASGYPTWCDEDEDKMLPTRCRDSFISIGQTRTSPGSLFTCSYYTDAVKRPVKQENVNSYHKKNNNNNNNGTFALPYTKGSTNGNFIPPKSSYRCSKGRHVLSPTAKNGRYLCIMASVGPRRMAISSASPLKYHAGMYACVVFDVLYGAVVRVIPVCPVLPRTAFTENGVSRSHSNTRRSPIYVLPCDVTVVHHPHTRRSEGFTASSSSSALPQGMSSGREDEGKSVFNGIHYFQRNSGGDGDDDEEEEEDEKEQGGRGVGGGRYGADENVMVLVAVGALHSTTYVFDALTGSRIKVVGLRKQMSASTILTSSQTRPRAKRARCSYVSLGSLGTFNSCHSHEVNGSGNHHDNADAENPHDSTSSASSSELPSRDEVQNDNQRQMLVNLLVEKYGMGTMLRTATELLRVVPLPFPLYNKTFQKDDMSSSRKDPRSTGHSRRQSSCDSDIQTSTGTSFSSPFSQSLPVSALLLKCPSFLGQLQRAASETALADGTSLRPSRADNEVSTTPVDLLHDVPFAHVEHREPSHVQQTSSGDGGVQVSLAESASSPNGESVPNYSRAAAKSRKQFRCGVVNSVALLYDEAKDGVYLFSSDEYGGLFMAGGLMSPHI